MIAMMEAGLIGFQPVLVVWTSRSVSHLPELCAEIGTGREFGIRLFIDYYGIFQFLTFFVRLSDNYSINLAVLCI